MRQGAAEHQVLSWSSPYSDQKVGYRRNMMEELILKMAKEICDSAEVYSIENSVDSVSFENARLKDIESRKGSGTGLRIIRNKKLGFSYTRNISDKERLIQNALDSIKGGVDGLFQFPLTKEPPALDTYDPSIETASNSVMVEECTRVCDLLSQKIKGQINVYAQRRVSTIKILNSSGTDLFLKSSVYLFNTEILYPYTSASLRRTLISKSFKKADDEYLSFLTDTYNQSARALTPDVSKIKVLFLPETMYVLMWRLQSAANGQSIYQNISPLANKIGEKIFNEKLSVYNDPFDDTFPGARAFDDEGTPCRKFPIVEEGVFRNFYYDLYFAQKMNVSPFGNGFREGESSKPVPVLDHLSITPGNKSFSDLVKSIDRGIIIAGALGAHSGNIPNGDFSIGIAPGLFVENGEIIGHVKDIMAAGNIYDTLNNIIDIENVRHKCFSGHFPSMLLDNLSVTAKK
jgi:PmbA protein